jgi:hypothetical protein
MRNANVTTNSLIDKLRRRIKDDRPVHTAMTVTVSDPSVSRAIAEVTDGHFIINIEGGKSQNVDLNLSDLRYSTVGRLHQALSRVQGITVRRHEDSQDQHISLDLLPIAPIDISANNAALELKHHLFSDVELDEVVSQAIHRHNPSFDVINVPANEEIFILQLAHAEVCRRQAYDLTKRQSAEEHTTSDLLKIAESIESAYKSDTERLARALISPQEATPNTMGQGDVVMGSLYRASLRTGRHAPFGAQAGPTAPILLEPEDENDVEDTTVRVRWLRNTDNDFYQYELWSDTRPDVTNNLDQSITQNEDYPVYYHYEGITAGTSRRVVRISGKVGQGRQSIVVTELEPCMTYYFRLFVRDTEGGIASSQVVQYRTKSLRTRFTQVSPLSTIRALANEVITLFFSTAAGEVTDKHRLYIGEYQVPLALIDAFTATATVPEFHNKRLAKQVVIESPSGLRDICGQLLTVL